ncbi:4Fe-4S dicluster domain-containing protein [Desulfoplanes formicivorans]|uniref:4Fe-4S ferredoxin n=1 Tax=Desulfoplanes formicivorans TaxID=1592317 RepID=A0A194AJ47_9BACT|nr:4Fe-4S binding protein [Desulfoplanes formicivorans]GAU09260.1 4Fe-4S ferredoxin [Desulfoplanes formicivorans]
MAKSKGQTRVRVFSDWCKGCGLCVAFCPGKVFEMGKDGKACVVREEECLNCGFCEMHCPDFAVSVRPREECNGAVHNGYPAGTVFKDVSGIAAQAKSKNVKQPEAKPVEAVCTES